MGEGGWYDACMINNEITHRPNFPMNADDARIAAREDEARRFEDASDYDAMIQRALDTIIAAG